MLDPFDDRRIPPVSVDLGPARKTGTYLVLDHVSGDFLLKFLNKKRPFRSGAHKTHISHKDIKKLGSLINACPPDDLSNCGYPGIPRSCPAALFLAWILDGHGTELVHLKGPVMEPHPFLAENNGPRRRELDGNGCHQHDGGKQDDPHQGAENIHRPLHHGVGKAV